MLDTVETIPACQNAVIIGPRRTSSILSLVGEGMADALNNSGRREIEDVFGGIVLGVHNVARGVVN